MTHSLEHARGFYMPNLTVIILRDANEKWFIDQIKYVKSKMKRNIAGAKKSGIGASTGFWPGFREIKQCLWFRKRLTIGVFLKNHLQKGKGLHSPGVVITVGRFEKEANKAGLYWHLKKY